MNEHKIVDRLLGYPVKDRVTQFVGVVTSVAFDLYGCVQCVVTPPAGEAGKMEDSRWFDEKRLEVTGNRVMPLPSFGDAIPGPQSKSLPPGA